MVPFPLLTLAVAYASILSLVFKAGKDLAADFKVPFAWDMQTVGLCFGLGLGLGLRLGLGLGLGSGSEIMLESELCQKWKMSFYLGHVGDLRWDGARIKVRVRVLGLGLGLELGLGLGLRSRSGSGSKFVCH